MHRISILIHWRQTMTYTERVIAELHERYAD